MEKCQNLIGDKYPMPHENPSQDAGHYCKHCSVSVLVDGGA
jgi:hypothetical protein